MFLMVKIFPWKMFTITTMLKLITARNLTKTTLLKGDLNLFYQRQIMIIIVYSY